MPALLKRCLGVLLLAGLVFAAFNLTILDDNPAGTDLDATHANSGGDTREVATVAGVDTEPFRHSVRNLVLICIDTVRADSFTRLAASTRDALKGWEEEALIFSQARTPAPWTLPTLGSVFTGLWPVQHGLDMQFEIKPGSPPEFSPTTMRQNVTTLAMAARKEGLETVVISASGWTAYPQFGFGVQRGFRSFHDFGARHYPRGTVSWQPMLETWRELIAGRSENTRSLDFLHFMEAHDWHLLDEEALDARIAEMSPARLALYRSLAPRNACADDALIYCKRFVVYLSAIVPLREAIAQVLETLQAKNLLQETAVMVFSDHGEEFADHADDGLDTKHGVFNDPKFASNFGHGHSLYEELLHVPLLVWHPDYEGKVIDDPVSLIDIAPTAARWLGLQGLSEQSEGWFLDDFDRLANNAGGRVIYSSSTISGEEVFSARQGDKKSIWYTEADQALYFDLEQDPLELQPLQDDDLVLGFDSHFLDYEQLRPLRAAPRASLTQKHLEDLQAIGYLQGVELEAEDE